MAFNYRYRSARELANAMDSAGNTSAAFAEIRRGMNDSFISSDIVPTRTINMNALDDRGERERYMNPRFKDALAGQPTIIGCGMTNAITPGGGRKKYYQGVMGFEIALELCRYDCGDKTTSQYLFGGDDRDNTHSMLYNLGASFGTVYREALFKGNDDVANWKGLFDPEYATTTDYQTQYGAYLDTKNDVEQANFFAAQMEYMQSPRILMDTSAKRVLGDEKIGTDGCGTKKWRCMLDTLATEGINLEGRIRYVEGLDTVIGINPLALTTPFSTMLIIDEANVGFALGDIQAHGADPLDGNKVAQKIYSLFMGGLEVDRELSIRAVYNFVDPAKVQADLDQRYMYLGDENRRPKIDLRD